MTTTNPLCHYSAVYLDFLRKCLPDATVQVLEHRSEGIIDGILPYATICHPKIGTVINSLPFFGSHGGPIGSIEVRKALLQKFSALVEDIDASSSTIVENPFQPLTLEEISASGHNLVDDRIGQFTKLPSAQHELDRVMLESFHVKTRNAIRKGQRLALQIEKRVDDASWEWMQSVHQSSIEAMGGAPKSKAIFRALRASFGDQATLHVGSVSGQPVCGLVTLYHHKTVEYFTPVIKDEWRETQALSALIFDLMLKSAQAGYQLWNWGGTWRTQSGVYRFKSRWGAFDLPYRYFNCVRKPDIKQIPVAELQAAFPHFYIFRYAT